MNRTLLSNSNTVTRRHFLQSASLATAAVGMKPLTAAQVERNALESGSLGLLEGYRKRI